MQVQQTLENKTIESTIGPERPWVGICCRRCWFAKRKPCRCKCGGENHRKGLRTVDEQLENLDKETAILKTQLIALKTLDGRIK